MVKWKLNYFCNKKTKIEIKNKTKQNSFVITFLKEKVKKKEGNIKIILKLAN